MSSTSKAVTYVALSLVAFGVTLLPGPWLPRFTFDPLNYWFTALSAITIPASLVVLGIALHRSPLRIAVLVIAAAAAVPLIPFGLLAAYEGRRAVGAEHPSHKRLAEVSTSSYTYRLYLTNCGATCAYGLELRKEISILGFAKLVAPVWSAYREEPAELRLSPVGEVQVVRGEYVLHTENE